LHLILVNFVRFFNLFRVVHVVVDLIRGCTLPRIEPDYAIEFRDGIGGGG
jgi:hypothetical protein